MAALLLLAEKSADVSAGAWMTLVLPLGFTIIALFVWWYLARRAGMAPESSEFTGPESEPPPTTARE